MRTEPNFVSVRQISLMKRMKTTIARIRYCECKQILPFAYLHFGFQRCPDPLNGLKQALKVAINKILNFIFLLYNYFFL